jgi:hypothetical protein
MRLAEEAEGGSRCGRYSPAPTPLRVENVSPVCLARDRVVIGV